LCLQRVWQIIHPERKNLTVIRGYTRLGGTPDDPTADPQDRAWFGPHDRLFRLEESEEIAMKPEPAYGTSPYSFFFLLKMC
jgi:alpha-1,3-mannosyltransferase